MHVAVLGAGVIGITSAYYLAEAGHEVTIIDQEDQVAGGCSYANGSQLSYSYVDAMASPHFLTRIPRILAGGDLGVRFRCRLTADTLRWGSAFLRQCTINKAANNTIAAVRMAQRSSALLARLRANVDLDFCYQRAGKLVLLSSNREKELAVRSSENKAQYSCDSKVISLDEAIQIEPAIAHMRGDYCAAIYSAGDDVGDARLFSRALAAHLVAQYGCKLQLGTSVIGFCGNRRAVTGVKTDIGDIASDAVVVALGAESPLLARSLGVKINVLPVRGYSITLEPGPEANAASLTDPSGRFVITRNGDSMRIAGFADFVGFNTAADDERIDQLLKLVRLRAPLAANFSTPLEHTWGGYRPLTPDGRPVIGETHVNGLYLNTGHGSLGWTLACASGEELANSISRAAQSSPSPSRRPVVDSLAAVEQEIV